VTALVARAAAADWSSIKVIAVRAITAIAPAPAILLMNDEVST